MATDVRKVAKSAGKGAAERLKAGYCLTSLSEAITSGQAPKGAAEGLKPGYCLTSLSEATRKLVDKPPTDGHRRPESCQKRRQERCGAFEGRLLPNVDWSH